MRLINDHIFRIIWIWILEKPSLKPYLRKCFLLKLWKMLYILKRYFERLRWTACPFCLFFLASTTSMIDMQDFSISHLCIGQCLKVFRLSFIFTVLFYLGFLILIIFCSAQIFHKGFWIFLPNQISIVYNWIIIERSLWFFFLKIISKKGVSLNVFAKISTHFVSNC